MFRQRLLTLVGFTLVATLAHAQAITVQPGHAELYDAVTNERFVPRGNSFVLVSDNAHVLLDPGYYNSTIVETELAQMRHDGYNVVRVFLNPSSIAESSSASLKSTYIANLVDFLRLAKTHHLYVIVAGSGLPNSYAPSGEPDPAQCPTNSSDKVCDHNLNFMTTARIAAAVDFWYDVATEIKNASYTVGNVSYPVYDTVMSYDVWNEGHFAANQKPFTLSEWVTLPAGTYDMSSATGRQLAADESAAHWFDEVRSAITGVIDGALVQASVFTPYAVSQSGYNGGDPDTDPRMPFRPSALESLSDVDIIDIHSYPLDVSGPYSFSDDMNSAEIDLLGINKPLVMGEFGAFKDQFNLDGNNSVDTDAELIAAAYGVRDHQIASCAYRFQGWVFWTWNSTTQPLFWATEKNGIINGILAPVNRIDPCQTDNPTAFVTGVSPSSTVRSNYTGWVGMKFTTGSSAMTVSSLGRFAITGNSRLHEVKLVNASTGADVSGAKVTVDMTDAAADHFRYALLAAPVTLAPNTAYYLVSKETNGGDEWYDYNTPLTSTSAATINGPAYGTSSSALTPVAIPGQGYVPLDLRYVQ